MKNRPSPVPSSGKRMPWSDLPDQLKAAVEEKLGGRVVEAIDQHGGFSPGVAARLLLDDGTRAFVKAAAPHLNPDTPGIYRREARIASAMPATAPVPRLLWSLDEGEEGWVVLAFEDVDGRSPGVPWWTDELTRVLSALDDLARTLTPAPFVTDRASAIFPRSIGGWWALRDDPPPTLDDWSRRNLDRLVQLEAESSQAVDGDSLVHLDIRSDNLLLTDRQVYVVDWPIAHIGAPWIDLVGFAPSVVLEGGPEPDELMSMSSLATDVDPAKIDSVVCAVAGFFTQRSLLPPPPGLPTLRAFQAAQGEVARRWLQHRTGWS